ncbi:TonB-dependent receptor plug domain-containing protein [Flavobacterium sp.]|uniref:TonB-dependent receptor plug domain-containing protein n=1 Tax=Flavobacterium sp. TaxID=239 RepID=UPI0037BE524C
MKFKNTKKFALSNGKGQYKFLSVNGVLNDTIEVKVNTFGYKEFSSYIIADNENIFFDIELEKLKTIELEEVVIKTENRITYKSDKSIYKINQKKFIKNAKATDLIGTIPNVYFNKQNENIIVEGTLKGKIFIDGIEAMPNEISTIYVSTIDKVEVMSNPSSLYGTDFLGAVINIITKKSNEQFFKGSLSITGGAKNNFFGISPNIAYKKGIVNFKSDFGYVINNQISTDKLIRDDIDGKYIHNTISDSDVSQKYINSRIGLIFSEKTELIFTNYVGGYTVDGILSGNSTLNGSQSNNFSNSSNTINKDFEISSIFKRVIDKNRVFYIKNKYSNLSNLYQSEYIDNEVVNFFNLGSKRKEFTSDLSFSIQNKNLYNVPTNLDFNIKLINRDFAFTDSDFSMTQNIYDFTLDINNTWTSKILTQASLTFEHLINKSNSFNKNYNLILPRLNILYKFKNDYNVSFGFSKKVLRPNPTDLNEALIIYSPVFGRQGNSNLEQQIRNYYSLRLNKDFEIDSFSLKIYRTSINNSIENIYKKEDNLLIQTVDNSSKYSSTGMDFGYSTRLFKKIDLNIDSGFNYNIYEINDISTFIKKNEGLSINASINISTNLFKDKVSVSFSGMQSGPTYSLLSKSVTYPYLDFSVSTNLFKEKFNLRFYVQNILGKDATGFKNLSYAENFSQKHVSRDNFSNLLLSLTYNFGKTFDDYTDDKIIENNDIRK